MSDFTQRVLLLMGFCFLTNAVSAQATVHSIDPMTDTKKLSKKIVAGDVVVLRDGVWKDTQLTFDRVMGTKEKPVTIRAQTSGEVVFTGESQLRFSGEHITVSGLVFRDTQTSDVLEARSHSQRHAHDCRITDCAFSQSDEGADGKESRWLSLYGTNNRVDHCRFVGKRSRGTTLVVWVSETPNHHNIDHNYFGPRPELGRNGGETIRIGTSEVAKLDSRTLVTDNYFDRCNGESEIVSNKSCENVYRHNVFHECSGALTLRHGDRCTVDGNVFLGNKKSGTGGVRIIGQSHVVTNNYFANLRGDEMRAAVSMMNAPESPEANGYWPVRDARVAHNTFVDCKVSMEIGVEASKTLSVAPANCILSSNLFVSGKWQPFRIHARPEDFQWSQNFANKDDPENDQAIAVDRVAFDLKADTSGLLRPARGGASLSSIEVERQTVCTTDIDGGKRSDRTLAGCDDPATPPRTWVDRQMTGPTWK